MSTNLYPNRTNTLAASLVPTVVGKTHCVDQVEPGDVAIFAYDMVLWFRDEPVGRKTSTYCLRADSIKCRNDFLVLADIDAVLDEDDVTPVSCSQLRTVGIVLGVVPVGSVTPLTGRWNALGARPLQTFAAIISGETGIVLLTCAPTTRVSIIASNRALQ